MTLKSDAQFEKELACRFKIDMRNLTNFDLNTQKSQKFVLYWAPFEQSIYNFLAKKVQRGYLS